MKRIATKPISDDATNLERLLAQIPSGRAICISYVRQLAIEDQKYLAFIRDFDASGKRADIGELCNRHSIKHNEFIADVMREAYPVADEALKLSHMISTGIVAARLPKVVERGMIEASKAEGIADRHYTLQKEGFHVSPKGMSISLNQINNTAAGLPSFEDETNDLNGILAVDGALIEDSLLESGETDYIEEEYEEEEQLVS